MRTTKMAETEARRRASAKREADRIRWTAVANFETEPDYAKKFAELHKRGLLPALLRRAIIDYAEHTDTDTDTSKGS